MKINKLIIALLLFFISACKEYFVTTKINPDGSCERIIKITDYNGNGTNDLRFYVDSTWTKKIERSGRDSNYTTTFSKKFNSIAELENEARKSPTFKPEIKLNKTFRWFYTYFDYSETYKRNNPFKALPLEKYFSPKDLDSLNQGLGEKSLSNKLEYYMQACMSAVMIDSVKKVMEKHSIHNEAAINEFFEKMDPSIFDREEKFTSAILGLCGRQKSPQLKNDLDSTVARLERKINNQLEPVLGSGFTSRVVMPGLLLESNSKSIEGNLLSWKVEPGSLIAIDLSMKATSRIANTWAFVVTGIILILLIALLLVPVLRKKKFVY